MAMGIENFYGWRNSSVYVIPGAYEPPEGDG